MIRLKQRDLGRVVLICFWDHSQNCDHPIYCEAVGKLTWFTSHSIHIRPWDCPRDKDVDTEDYCILRAVVKSVSVLR